MYSLGVLLYESLTGRLAFEVGESGAGPALARMIAVKQAHPVLDPGEAFSDDLRSVVLELTQADPDLRPDMGAARQALASLCEPRPADREPAPPEGRRDREEGPPPPREPGPAPRTRHRWTWAGIALLVALAGLALRELRVERVRSEIPDEGPAPGAPPTWYADGDGDGYGDPTRTRAGPEAPPGFVSRAGDCDDRRASIRPGAFDRPDDALDQDCDGVAATGRIYAVLAPSRLVALDLLGEPVAVAEGVLPEGCVSPSLAYLPDGVAASVVCESLGETSVQIFDRDLNPVRRIPVPVAPEGVHVSWDPAGRRLLLTATQSGEIWEVDPGGGRAARLTGVEEASAAVRLPEGGPIYVASHRSGRIHVLDGEGAVPREIARLPVWIRSMVPAPGGRLIASSFGPAGVHQIWEVDPATGRTTLLHARDKGFSLCTYPGGLLYTQSSWDLADLPWSGGGWRARPARGLRPRPDAKGVVLACATDAPLDADGDGVVSGGWGGPDCDDYDPAARPGGVEIPGNGRDEDCDGADAEAALHVASPDRGLWRLGAGPGAATSLAPGLGRLLGLASAGGRLYATSEAAAAVLEIDPRTGAVRQIVSGRGNPGGISADPRTGQLLVTFVGEPGLAEGDEVVRVDPATGRVESLLHGVLDPLAALRLPGGDAIHVVGGREPVLYAWAPEAATVVAAARLPGPADGLAPAGGDALFAASSARGEVYRVDPATGQVLTVLHGLEGPLSVCTDPQGRLVVAEEGARRIRVRDPATGRLAPLPGAHGLAGACASHLAPDGDGDGVFSAALGGADCDDADPRVGRRYDMPGNGLDEDCDGADAGIVVYLLDREAGRVEAVERSTGRVLWSVGGLGFSTGLARLADGRLIVARTEARTLAELVPERPGYRDLIRLQGRPDRLSWDAARDTLLVADWDRDRVLEWDARTGALSELLSGLEDPVAVPVPGGDTVYVASRRGKELQAFDRRTGQLRPVAPLPGTPVQLILEGTKRLYTPTGMGNSVVAVDLDSGTATTLPTAFRQPFGLCLDPGAEGLFVLYHPQAHVGAVELLAPRGGEPRPWRDGYMSPWGCVSNVPPDRDGDGAPSALYGGPDCDDSDPARQPWRGC